MSVRMSQLAKCPRMAAYGALDTLTDELAYDPEESWFRGKVYEAVSAMRLQAEHGAEFDGQPNIERQVVIPWDLGEGHADCYVRSARKIVEVKSSVDDSDVPLLDGITQCALYTYFHPEAEVGEVHYYDPRSGSFKPMRIPVEPLDANAVQVLVSSVDKAIMDTDPESISRVCAHPRDGRQHLCPFVSTCFASWAEPVQPLGDDDEALIGELAGDWVRLMELERQDRSRADALHAERKEIEQRLRDLVDVGTLEVDGHKITRTAVSGAFSLPLKKARSSGLWTDAHDEIFGQLISERRGHERWKVEPVAADDTPAGDDESVPF